MIHNCSFEENQRPSCGRLSELTKFCKKIKELAVKPPVESILVLS
jgi:hypothetical protein